MELDQLSNKLNTVAQGVTFTEAELDVIRVIRETLDETIEELSRKKQAPEYLEKLPVAILKRMTLAQFTKYAEDVIQPSVNKRISGLALRFPYPLNTSSRNKQHDCSKVLAYTAFLNNSGTICHIVSADDPDFLFRIRFRSSIKHLSLKKQRIAVWMRAHHYVDVGACPK